VSEFYTKRQEIKTIMTLKMQLNIAKQENGNVFNE
jgi:hypothetical protein